MLNKKISIWVLIAACAGAVSANAQNNTNSPYSRYGYGILDDNSFGMDRAMGGIGYGLQSSGQINVKNPASYASMDSLTFLFDFGVNLQNVWMKESPTSKYPAGLKQKNINGNLEYIVMQFPLSKKMAASVGLVPYSYVGYSYGGTLPNGDDTKVGEGGINQAYAGIGYRPVDAFSIGFNMGYLFGNVTHSNYIIPSSGNTVGSLLENKMHVSDFHIEFGAQYAYQIKNKYKDKLIFGVVYSPKKSLLGSMTNTVSDYTSSSESVVSTTSESLKNRYQLPNSYGGGFTYMRKNNFIVGADFTYQAWAKAKYAGVLGNQNNRMRVSLGGEYIPDAMSKNFGKQMHYRAGLFYNKAYQKIDDMETGKQCDMREIGVSCGFGIPVLNSRSLINVALEYVNRQTTPKKLITENYLRLSISLTFNEKWFYKEKIN